MLRVVLLDLGGCSGAYILYKVFLGCDRGSNKLPFFVERRERASAQRSGRLTVSTNPADGVGQLITCVEVVMQKAHIWRYIRASFAPLNSFSLP